jgi:hypothetical protein
MNVVMGIYMKKKHFVGFKMKITKQILEKMQPGEQFATGRGIYPQILRNEIIWVAVRGIGYHDWCIYYGYSNMSIQEIANVGAKMFTKEVIERLVLCDEEAWNLYRF